MTGRVLIVCAANICRSPYTEFRLRAELLRRDVRRLEITSAGIAAEPGVPMCDVMERALNGHRASRHLDEYRSRALDPSDADADLILAADRSVLRAVLRQFPEVRAKTFTLPQAAILAGRAALPWRATLEQAVDVLHHVREETPSTGYPPIGGAWWRRRRADPVDVPDPHVEPVGHRQVQSVLNASVDRLAPLLARAATA